MWSRLQKVATDLIWLAQGGTPIASPLRGLRSAPAPKNPLDNADI